MGYMASSILGMFTIDGRMIYLESKSQDSDFDLIFILGLVVWSAAVWVLYAFYSGIVVVAKKCF